MYSGMSLEDVMATDVTPGIVGTAIKEHWTIERELLATIAEILHLLLITTAKAHGGKSLPEPLKIPRPHGVAAEDKPVGAGLFTRQLTHGGGF